MILLALQYDKWSGPDAVGQHKLTFTMDESINAGEFNPLSIKKGTQFIVTLTECGTEEDKGFSQETEEQTRERFFKQFHALITEVAKLETKPADQLKAEIKATLIAEGKIKESSKEMTNEQLATEIIRLKKYKNEIQHAH